MIALPPEQWPSIICSIKLESCFVVQAFVPVGTAVLAA